MLVPSKPHSLKPEIFDYDSSKISMQRHHHPIKYVLILGYGNVCRSPFAERLLADRLAQYAVLSAGVYAVAGERANPVSQELAEVHGISLGSHLSMPVTKALCEMALLTLVMERRLVGQLERRFPSISGKVFPLGDVQNFDVVDPYCQTRDMFRLAFNQIESGIEDWVPRIQRM